MNGFRLRIPPYVSISEAGLKWLLEWQKLKCCECTKQVVENVKAFDYEKQDPYKHAKLALRVFTY